MEGGKEAPWKRILLFLGLLLFLSSAGLGLAMPFLPLYIRELGAPEGSVEFWAGLTLGVTFIGMGAMQPVWGAWADRFGRKAMVLRAALGSALAIGLLASARSVYEIFAWRALHGLFGGFVSASNALIACVAPAERRGRCFALLHTAMVAGMLCGPLLGGVLADRFGYRICFGLTAILIAAGGLLVGLGVPSDAPRTREAAGTGLLENLRRVRRQPALLSLFACQALSQVALMSAIPVLSLFIGDFAPAPRRATYAGLAFAASSITMLATSWAWGRQADERGYQRVLGICLAGCGLAYLPMGLAGAAWQVILLRMLLGAFMGGISPASHGLIAAETEEERRAGIMGVMAGMSLFGTALGPILGGWIGQRIGVRWVFFFAAILLLAAWRMSRRIAAVAGQGALPSPRPPETVE